MKLAIIGAGNVGGALGKSWAEKASSGAELTVPARMLGPLYNGYLSPSIAASAGLIDASDEDALTRADRVNLIVQVNRIANREFFVGIGNVDQHAVIQFVLLPVPLVDFEVVIRQDVFGVLVGWDGEVD